MLRLHGLALFEVVGFLFSRLVTEECDLHWILVATFGPCLPARIPTALRQKCNVVVCYLGPPESMQQDFVVTLIAHIKDADSVATLLWDDVLADFVVGTPADFTGYGPQDSGDDEVETVNRGLSLPRLRKLQSPVSLLRLSPRQVFLHSASIILLL